MLSKALKRVAMLVGALPLLVLAGPVASASAEVEASKITSPASPTYVLYDTTLNPPHNFTVTGTTTGTGNIALRCYYGSGPKEYKTLVKEVEPKGGTFSTEAEAKELYLAPCVLRAVPFGTEASLAPGTSAEEAKDPFQGPRIVGSSFSTFPEKSTSPYDYEAESNTLAGYFDFESVGECGLDYSRLYAPTSLVGSAHLFDCNAALFEEDNPPSGPSTRSQLQIDGANAYSPAAANYVNEEIQKELKTTNVIPGAPQVAVTKTFDEATGLITIHEVDPIVKCSPSTTFPPTAAGCTSFVSAGVQLERTWQTSDADQLASMTDTWRSTDGAPHSLNAFYNQQFVNEGEVGGAYEFPGDSTFSPAVKGQVATPPTGASAVYYKEDAATPSGGDGKHPQGAVVYDTRPTEPLSVYSSTAPKEERTGFEMPYQSAIPAGGTYTLRMAFVQAYALSEVETLAHEVLASYHPTLTIGKPANGEVVSASSVTVSGTASDSEGTPTLTVNGKAVSVGASGAWSTSTTLNKGANTITAVATNQLGLTAEKSVSVTYSPVSPPPVKPHAKQVGATKGNNGEVTFTLICKGASGTSCEVESTLTTIEKLRRGRPVAVSARRHPRNRTERVTVGFSKLTIPAGQKVTISIVLNSTGKSLLARFGALPVHLSVVQLSAGHRSTVIAQNLTVTAHRKPRHHHHHHRHHHR